MGKISLAYLSDFRTQIMGFAVIGVMIVHIGFNVPSLFNYLQTQGDLGVDFFAFLSGFGIFFALKKVKSLSYFYKRRFLRIIPLYLIGITILYLFCNFDSKSLLTFSFWHYIAGRYWYILFVLFMYLFSPLIYKYLLDIFLWGGVILIYLAYGFIDLTSPFVDVFIPRIIDFIVGMIIARSYSLGQQYDKAWLIGIGFIGMIVVGYSSLWTEHSPFPYNLHRELRYTGALLAVPLISYILAFLCKFRYISGPLKWLGIRSLECYIAQIIIEQVLIHYDMVSPFLFFPISFFLAEVLYLISKGLTKYLYIFF